MSVFQTPSQTQGLQQQMAQNPQDMMGRLAMLQNPQIQQFVAQQLAMRMPPPAPGQGLPGQMPGQQIQPGMMTPPFAPPQGAMPQQQQMPSGNPFQGY